MLNTASPCIRRRAFGIAVVPIVPVAVLALAVTGAAETSVGGILGRVNTPHTRVITAQNPFTFGFHKLPIPFEPNVGQAPPQIKYLGRANGFLVGLTEQGITLKLGRATAPRLSVAAPTHRVQTVAAKPVFIYVRAVYAGPNPQLQPEQRLKSISNYFLGNNAKNWYSDVPNYAVVRYKNIYPGIDWVIYGNPNQLEYNLVVAPHADPGQIKFSIKGAEHLGIDKDRNLVITAGNRSLRELKPVVYQLTTAGKRRPVIGSYVLDGQEIAFALGNYDHTRPLVIDPVLVYSTYLGSGGGAATYGGAVDGAGDIYVTGQAGQGFPTVTPYQAMSNGGDIFICKFSADGSNLVYSTFLGNNGADISRGIAVDSAGNAYVTGTTYSKNFPTVNAFQATNKSTSTNTPAQAFITKLNAAGDALVYSTYLGGSGNVNDGFGIAVDSAGEAYVIGDTDSVDFPTANPFQGVRQGRMDAFVTKFSVAGNSLVYSTYLGGSADQQGYAIAVDTAGSAYVTGITNSTDFPLVNPYQATNKAALNNSGYTTGFVTKFSPIGNSLNYSTYLGGSYNDGPEAIAVDSNNSAYVTGWTTSTDFPVVNAYQRQFNGSSDAFVTKFAAAGNALVYSTYLGGSSVDVAKGIAIDTRGDAYVVGGTDSTDFPTMNPIQAKNLAVGLQVSNGFVTELNAVGKLLFSSYLGGSGSYGPNPNTTGPVGDAANSVALDYAGNVYVVGETNSADFPTYCPFQATNENTTIYGSGSEGFVTKIAVSQSIPTPCASQPLPPSGGENASGSGAVGWLAVLVLSLILSLRFGEIRNKP